MGPIWVGMMTAITKHLKFATLRCVSTISIVAFAIGSPAAGQEGRTAGKGQQNPQVEPVRQTSIPERQNKAGRPIVIAHRGASGYLPEHTLEAVTLAHAMGADFIEQDIVLSKDNVPVVLHDIHLDTVTDVATKFPNRRRKDGRYYAIDFSLKEIKTLNVGERINLKTGRAVYPKRFTRGKSAFQVPTLREEIELIQELNRTRQRNVGIYVEIKAPAWHRDQGKDISRIALAIIERSGYRTRDDRAYVQCFDFNETRRIREELNSDLKLVQLLGDKKWNKAKTEIDKLRQQNGLKEIAEYADGIGPAMSHVIHESKKKRAAMTDLVSEAHEVGLLVHAYTLRADALPGYAKNFDELSALFLNQAKVDGVFTDFPDQTKSVADRLDAKK